MRLQRLHHAELVLRGNAGKSGGLPHRLAQLLVAHGLDFHAAHRALPILQDT